MKKEEKMKKEKEGEKKGKKEGKKAQQEIFGFVIIILLVIVIGIIVLSFSLQRSMRKPMLTENIKVNDLLHAMAYYTVTNCENNKLSRVIVKCGNGEKCGQEDACVVLKNTTEKILNESFPALGFGYFNGYNLTISTSPPIAIAKGMPKGNIVLGSYFISMGPGQSPVEMKLYLYYSTKRE